MKKISEYVEQFEEAEDKVEITCKIAVAFIIEVKTEIKERHAKRDEACFSIFEEQNKRWKAFANKVGSGVKENGFFDLLKHRLPEIHLLWEEYRKSRAAVYR